MRPTLTIDLSALAANYRFFRDARPDAEIGAAVKCDAYGIGVARAAPRLFAEGCRSFFVATMEEGAELRGVLNDAAAPEAATAEPAAPAPAIYVLNGPGAGEAAEFLRHGLIPVLNSAAQIARWREGGRGRPAALHVDTGMTRLGLRADEAQAMAAADGFAGLDIALLMTHLACADEADHPMNAAQAAAFDRVAALFPRARRSFGASAGGLLFSASWPARSPSHPPAGRRDRAVGRGSGPAMAERKSELLRIGIGLYGGGPSGAPDPRLRPAATAEAEILQLRAARAGETVGYGATRRLARDSTLAVLNVGYGDGYLRSGSGRGEVFFPKAGGLAPVAGRISMDLTAVDVTDLLSGGAVLREGDRAELFGPNLPLDIAASAAQTISYELLTALGRRYRRIYKD
ncbi:MAG: alanine racemase [Parvularculaceae bacterium]